MLEMYEGVRVCVHVCVVHMRLYEIWRVCMCVYLYACVYVCFCVFECVSCVSCVCVCVCMCM